MGSKTNCISVLMPNGRRESLKVNLDSSVLQILEDVCAKHGFNSEEYALRHHNKILDPGSIVRFCSLPNNAFLEVVPSIRHSQESKVILSLQIDGENERLSGEFPSDTSLENILLQLAPKIIQSNDNKVPVVVYMRREIVGLDAFKVTTLRSLGLISGRALLRVSVRDNEEHPDLQCTGRGSILVRSISEKKSPSPTRDQPEKCNNTEVMINQNKPDHFCATAHLSESDPVPAAEIITAAQVVSNVIYRASASDAKKKVPEEKKHFQSLQETKVIEKSPEKKRSLLAGKFPRGKSPVPMDVDVHKKEQNFKLEDVKYLGERNGLVFPLQDSDSSFSAELPDSFFDVTVDDVRLLMRDLKRVRESMENSPLQTENLRKIEMENKIKHYSKTVLRIQFPDRFILQGVFEPTDTVSDVINFVKNYIRDPKTDFYLYTSPPKTVLQAQDTLFDVGCVPCAKIYFSYANQNSDGSTSTQSSLDDKVIPFLTTQAIATFAAAHLRGLHQSGDKKRGDVTTDANNPSTSVSVSVSSSKYCNTRHKVQIVDNDEDDDNLNRPSNSPRSSQGKVPKWFKPV